MFTNLLHPTHTVRHIKNVLIPMSDGVRIAADLFMPEGDGRFPAVFEFLPYRKDDRVSARWNAHYYFAERGFVGVRADIRGTGGSEGVATDEYTPQEQQDACEIIAWAGGQPWCNGNVGMFGTSYGGFNTLQTAMHNPPALKAIVPHAATDDRYNDDVHYSGGCLMGIDQVVYPGWMVPMNAMPPYPQYTTEDWAGVWRQHLEGNPPWLLEWLRHQTEDEYWLQGSLKTDYASIRCPILHLGGWQDGYTNPVFRMLEHLKAPNRAIVGPWQHSRPNDAYPEPRINHLHEMARWWAHWLRDEDTGVMREPQLAVYVQHGARPHPFLPHMPGEWRYEEKWPPDRLEEQSLYLAGHGELRAEPEANNEADDYTYHATVGVTAGFWCPLPPPWGLARDQATDEARSLNYATAPFEEPLEILGFPKATLHVSSSAEIAFFCVKISDVAPDGSSTLVSRGILNATHRKSHRDPEPLTPGETYELEIPLKVVSWVFKPGHRLRVSISSSDWPTIWPSPLPATNKIYHGRARPSRIILPVAGPSNSPISNPQFQPAIALPPRAETRSERPIWRVAEDVVEGVSTVYVRDCHRVRPVGEDFEVEEEQIVEAGASDAHPDRAYAKSLQRISMFQPAGRTDLFGRIALRSTTTQLHVDVELRVRVDGEKFFDRQWVETIPRHFV
ncbi:MAG: CocE/NonD family hydrolase [Anaerolineales bacterium]